MGWKLSNFAESAFEQSCSDSDTTLYINADDVDNLPALTLGDKAKAVIIAGDYKEIINITAWTTDGTLTVERGQEGTAARAWDAGALLIHTPTAEILQNILGATASVIFSGTTTNVGNLYTVNVGAGNTLPAFTDGELATFVISSTNSGPVTLKFTDGVTTTATKDVVHQNAVGLESGDFAASYLAQVRYSSAADDWYLISQTSLQLHATQINDGAVPAINRHRNGNLDFWNHGTSFATPASGSETADGWLVSYDGTIGTFTVNRQSFALGQTDVPGDPKYYIRWDQSSAGAGSTVRKFLVKIPGVHWRNGEEISRRVYLKADAARTVSGRIIQDFGSGGSPSAQVVSETTAYSVTTAWQAFDVVDTLPSIAGKTLGSNGDDAIWLELVLPVNVTMTIDVAADDLRAGESQGLNSDTFPLPWWFGGVGGSYNNSAEFVSTLGLITTGLYPDLVLVEALAGSGIVVRNNTGPTWVQRSIAVGTGLSVSNADGTAGNPTVSLGTALTNYNADPLSVAELASVTAVFGTAAFVNTGTSGATVPLLNGANTFGAAQTVSITAAGTALTVQSTDAGAGQGPDIAIDRNSASPAAADVLGGILHIGRDSTAASTVYARTYASILDPVNGSEDGQYTIELITAGAQVNAMRLDGTTGSVFLYHILGPSGSATAPSHSFSGDPNTGMYNNAVDSIGFATNGVLRWQFESGGDFVSNGSTRIRCGDGSVSAPGYQFQADSNTGMYRIGADNIGFALNGVLYLDLSTTRAQLSHDAQFAAAYGPTSIYAMGYRGAPVNSQSTAYTLVLTDAGHTIYHDEVTARVYTIPANSSVAFPIGTTIIIDNTGNSGAAGTITLSITTDTLRRGDGTAGTGSRTIAAGQVAVIRKTKSTEWVITGSFT